MAPHLHPAAPHDPERGLRRRAALWLWLLNVLVGTTIGMAYLANLKPADNLQQFLFRHLGLLSTIGILSLGPVLLLWLLSRVRFVWRAVVPLQALVWTFFHLGLVIDTRIFRLFGYHFNGSAVNFLSNRSADGIFRVDARIVVPAALLCGAMMAGEWVAWSWIMRRLRAGGSVSLRPRPALVCCALLAAAVCVEKAIYARAELSSDRGVTAESQVFPMYPRLTVIPLLPEEMRAELERATPALSHPGSELRPVQPLPSVDPAGPRPNILVLVVDSWRADMLDPEVTPELAAFARGGRRFEDHLSTGNATRFGLFGMLYGLHGTYWWPTLAAGRPPVLLEVLEELGYDMRVFSSASMDYPEFRATAWAGMQERVADSFPHARPHQRDLAAVEACREWWGERRAGSSEEPFFSFVLLDSAHQPYDFPAGEAPFAPYAPEIDYIELAGSRDPAFVQRVRNRYRNSLLHADRVAALLLEDLRAHGELDDTLVIVTGDHGEEFAEHGYWGHTGNFTPEQVAVPFVLHGPGITPGVESRPTSHLDLPRTLLSILGADPAQADTWCLGVDLRSPLAERTRVVAAWEDVGLVTDREILRLPREARRSFCTSALTFGWDLAQDQQEPFLRGRAAIEALAEECWRFLQPPALARGSR